MTVEKIESLNELIDFIKQRIADNYDCTVIVSGEKGVGKSTLALQIAIKYLQLNDTEKFKSFIESNVIFDVEREIGLEEDAIKNFLKSKNETVIIFDEAFRDFGKYAWFEKNKRNQLIKAYIALTTLRYNNNVHIFCLPKIYLLSNFLKDTEATLWLWVVKRGTAEVFVRDAHWHDNFHLKELWKNVEKMRKNIFDEVALSTAIRVHKCHIGTIYFNTLNFDFELEYLKKKQKYA